jgi:2,4-dienoyl-CoA reductase-like NADH-dependent reductase (Old Yellow Enzyme family)
LSRLFSPIRLGGLELRSRVIAAPMCQYSALEGVVQPWHWQHLGVLAISGVSAAIVEATGVLPEGRISPGDTGLWNEAQEAAFARLLRDIATFSDTPIGIQLAHAGRKASTHRPWEHKGGPLGPSEGAWTTFAPSPVPFDEGWHTPEALDEAGMDRVTEAFVAAAGRADRAGFRLAELRGAHGYLLSEFLSPVANRRTDAYGGTLANRMRFPLRIAEAVRAVWPRTKALGMRLNGSDWVEGGITPEETAEVSARLQAIGLDYVHISSGASAAHATMPGREPGYQVAFAETVKRRCPSLPVIAVGMIAGAHQAEAILEEGKADMIALARALLDDPRWPLHASETLDPGAPSPWPVQYQRAAGAAWPGRALRDFG